MSDDTVDTEAADAPKPPRRGLWKEFRAWTGAAIRTPDPTDGDLTFLHTGRLVKGGLTIILIFVVGFFGWAGFVPLASATVAQGVIVVESHRKTIQHLEGGIVREIKVKEGQLVQAGQVLLVLDDTQPKANLALLQDEADALTALQARLMTERDGADTITFPPELMARQDDPKVAEDIHGEEKTFESRRDTLKQQVDILTSRKGENDRIIAGLKAEQDALEKQIGFIAQEQSGVQDLVNKGLERVPRLLGLQRNAADLTGQRGQLIEKISQTDLNTGETQLQIVNLKSQRLDDVLKDLRDAQTKYYDVMDRIQAARDVLKRTVMIAPVAGRVVSLEVHTRGAVIKPGDTVLEVVPENDKLEVEAHVRPEDADNLYVGMVAKVNLGAYRQRRMPMITGIVTEVSADRLVDAHTGTAYFNAIVSVDRSQLKNSLESRIIPGMPVDVDFQTGSRTALSYFVEPIRDVMNKGMREK